MFFFGQYSVYLVPDRANPAAIAICGSSESLSLTETEVKETNEHGCDHEIGVPGGGSGPQML